MVRVFKIEQIGQAVEYIHKRGRYYFVKNGSERWDIWNIYDTTPEQTMCRIKQFIDVSITRYGYDELDFIIVTQPVNWYIDKVKYESLSELLFFEEIEITELAEKIKKTEAGLCFWVKTHRKDFDLLLEEL
jgi:hypothetical protein